MGFLFFLIYLILTKTIVNSVLVNTNIQQNESTRLGKMFTEKTLYPRTKTYSTLNHHSTGLHNSFGVSGNVGIGFHFGSGYRIKNGNGNDDQEIMHHKIYDKYLGTSFGFGSLGSIKKGHTNNNKQTILADQHTTHYNENNVADQEFSTESTFMTTEKPKLLKKISDFWTGEHSESKSDYTNNSILKWSMQKFKNKNGSPR